MNAGWYFGTHPDILGGYSLPRQKRRARGKQIPHHLNFLLPFFFKEIKISRIKKGESMEKAGSPKTPGHDVSGFFNSNFFWIIDKIL